MAPLAPAAGSDFLLAEGVHRGAEPCILFIEDVRFLPWAPLNVGSIPVRKAVRKGRRTWVAAGDAAKKQLSGMALATGSGAAEKPEASALPLT
jgi:hypothetical protein